jgi:hypothetical protein
MNDICLGKFNYTKKQLDEFGTFQDSEGTRRAYLEETAELAYTGRNEREEWELALGVQAQSSMIDSSGCSSSCCTP